MILWFWLTTKTFGFQVYQTILPHHRPPFEKDGFIPARRNRFRALRAHEETCHSRNTSNPKDRCSSPPGSPICFCSHELSRRSWRDKTEALDGAVPRGKPPSSSRHAQLRMLNTPYVQERARYTYMWHQACSTEQSVCQFLIDSQVRELTCCRHDGCAVLNAPGRFDYLIEFWPSRDSGWEKGLFVCTL